MAKSAQAQLSVLPALTKRMKRIGRQHAFKADTPAKARIWAKSTRAILRKLTGYDTMETCPLRPRVTERVECDGYVRQRVVLQVEPGIDMTLYVLLPADLKPDERRPAIICNHGHSSAGKLGPAGVDDDPTVADIIDTYNYAYGVDFARRGLIAFCPDARGFGERQEPTVAALPHASILSNSCQFINQMAYPLGQTVTGMWTWDLHRLLDYIETHEACDASRIGCAGLSGGGLQTLWAAALDDRNRIKAAIVSGYFYGYKESLLDKHENCSCNYVPHLYEHVDMGDIGALVAPRPLLIETGDQDPLNGASGLKNVRSQLSIARQAYRVFDAKTNLKHAVFEGEHRWDGIVGVPWMVKQLTA